MVKTHQWDKQPRKPHACPEAQSGTVAQPWLSQRQVHGTEKSSDHRAGCVGGHQEWMLTWPQRKAIVPQRNDENFGPAGPIEWSAKQGARVFLSFFFPKSKFRIKHYPPANAGDAGSIPWVRKIPWRREWQPTPVFSPGQSHEQRVLEGYGPWNHKSQTRLSHREHTHNVSEGN